MAIGFSIDCRSDLSALKAMNPEAFDRFNNLRIEIDSPLIEQPEGVHASGHENRRHRRFQAIREMEETLVYIRQLPGFKGFQLPPPSEDLIAMAGEGPVVIFNSTDIRSDAIIVTASVIKTLRLPKLLYEEAKGWMSKLAQELVRIKRSTHRARNEEMRKLLFWLWDAAVKPVLEELQLETIAEDDDNQMTRIWWIGVDFLAMAPFHAAGDHSPSSTENTMSRVISSYIPTIKALSYAREKKLEILKSVDSRLLMITMPTTPNASPLKNAIPEVDEIDKVVEGKIISVRLNSPTTTQVLKELPSCHAIHFACHGVSDGATPSNSHLLLLKDNSPETGKLTVGAISDVNLKNAQLAYLSACCTADNPSTALADESIHIASAFQLAGFSHVLATLWESKDTACRQVSGDFYRLLFDGQGSKEHRKVSTAFHHAVKKLRDQNWRQPLLWASFIHTGA